MSGEEKSCGTKDCKIVIMEKEPIFKKRRVCEPSAAGTGASILVLPQLPGGN